MKGGILMLDVCIYLNQVPSDNEICNNCVEFMNSCSPRINSIDGFSSTSECGIYLCSGCIHDECLYRGFINL